MWPPTRLIPWFSKIEGNTSTTLLHHPFLFKGKPTQCSRGSKKDFWRRCRGGLREVKSRFDSRQRAISSAVAGEVFAKSSQDLTPTTSHFWCHYQVKTYQVPITNSYPSHYIICHLPLVFLSPTSTLMFYSPSLFRSPLFPFACRYG